MSDRGERPPCGNAHFLVDLGAGDPRAPAAGYAEVVFPPFAVDDGAGGTPPPRLVLRRGVTGANDLVAWWNRARRGTAPRRRTVTVQLLADDHATVVRTWRFRNARPVSLSYGPLRALDGGVLMETIELAYDRVDVA